MVMGQCRSHCDQFLEHFTVRDRLGRHSPFRFISNVTKKVKACFVPLNDITSATVLVTRSHHSVG